MAVPKKRTTNSTKGQRRSHDALKQPQLVMVAGVALPHRLVRAAKLGLLKNK
ncbi:MAG TPA: 50S ribosomal protein L32 [Candidatus Saccharimonadales bacterium]|nr:50S ribosomal protein L32 [Candidatus Saccharimonadales bacterium]